jgi:hypothetical protein
MKYAIVEKARPHKYIKRTGMPGKFEYVYHGPRNGFTHDMIKRAYGEEGDVEYKRLWKEGKDREEILKTLEEKFGKKEGSWNNFPLRTDIGEQPSVKDVPPRVTKDGDFILYHGTSDVAADQIIQSRTIKADDIGSVGIATIPEAAQTYATHKIGEGKPTILEVVVDKNWLSKQQLRHEIGGHGHSAFLINPDYKSKTKATIPPEAIKDVKVHKVELSKEEQIDAFVEKLESGEFKVSGATVTNPAGYLKNKIFALKNDIKAWESMAHDEAKVAELKERLEGYEEVLRRIQPAAVKEPKVLYHGTSSKPFKRFYAPEEVPEELVSYGQHSMGVYLSDNPKMAGTFGSRVVKVAQPKKTLDLTGAKTFDDFVALLPIDKEKAAWELKRMKVDSMWGDEDVDMQYKLIESLDDKFGIVRKLKEMGYDSLRFKEEHSSQEGNTTVVFDPHALKIVKAVDSDIKPGVAARLITEDGYQVWGAFPKRTRPMRSYSKDDEAEKELDRIVNELTDSIWAGMKYVIIEKARPHKYIKRTGAPGRYEYTYTGPRAVPSKAANYFDMRFDEKEISKEAVGKAKINESLAKKYWVKDYHNFEPHDTPDGHWGKHQAGLNISRSGKIFLSDNRKVKDEEGWGYPSHRDIDVGSGVDRTSYSAIYSFEKEWGPTIWLYPDTEGSLNKEMRIGLSSLIGVHQITADTPVRSNTGRNILFRLGNVVRIQKDHTGEVEVFPVGGSGEGVYKARPHKYIRRTGIPGHFEYTYSEEAQRDAEQDISGIKDLKPELTAEDKRLKYHLDLLFEGVNEGIHRPEKAGMLIDKIKKLTGTIPAYALGKTISKEQASELWKEYKKATAESLKELDVSDLTPEQVHKFEASTFLHQLMRETVAGYLGEEGKLAFTRDEIEEKLGLIKGY